MSTFSLFNKDIKDTLMGYEMYVAYGQEVFKSFGINGSLLLTVTYAPEEVVLTKHTMYGRQNIVIDINIIKSLCNNYGK